MFRSFDAPDNLSRLSGVYEGAGTATPLDTFNYANNGFVSARSEGTAGASIARPKVSW